MSEDYEFVQTKPQIRRLADLASAIWNEHFPTIIGQEQVDYMVCRFQSESAITKQIRSEGYRYYFIASDGKNVGYFAIRPDPDALFLSKIYILRDYRGRGLARASFEFIEDQCRLMELPRIRLTVNRGNAHTIEIYRKIGFSIVRTQVVDIGGGFVMDDYVMEKTILPSPTYDVGI
ncbi:MAG: GNAT family N-acetyltransferase [Clostridiales bacterium]|nr:GNAT family N-acetyltransferase [Clostridiales bacterium]